VASSFMSTAIARVFGTALSGRGGSRQNLADAPIPLEAHVPLVSCRGGADLARRLFEPLGYGCVAEPIVLDEHRPDWGDSPYIALTLRGEVRLQDLLRHLYVLLPVMDDAKHYWVERSEIDKLLAKGEEWLAQHPARTLITRRFLRHRAPLMREALARLAEESVQDLDERAGAEEEETLERQVSLAEQRIGAVLAVLRSRGAKRVIDLGCGSGKLLAALSKDPSFERIVGTDVSVDALEAAGRRLHVDEMSTMKRERFSLFQSALTYRDRRLDGMDAAVLMEVIEHVDPERLPALEGNVFGSARPATVVVTTPNVEYNSRFDGLPEGHRRHRDHRFEWTREDFRRWAGSAAERSGYAVRFLPVGPVDPEVGPPTQMAVFER
jgi:3' terminal RNA ribose 2'-O-methyltransferase Hen1